MIRQKTAATALLIGLFAPATTLAQSYFSIGAGMHSLDGTDFQVAPGNIDTEFDDGEILSIAYGWRMAGYRAEIELSSMSNDVESHSLNGGAELAGATGEASATALMGNILLDIDTGSAFTPYFGAGIGFADVDADGFGVAAIPDVLNDGDSVLAYQLILGGSFALSPTASLFAQYNWFNTEEAEVSTSVATGAVPTDIDYEGYSFRVGARFDF